MIPQDIRLYLASKSPRRKQLLTDMGLKFELKLKEVEEVFPATLAATDVAEYLAKLKASVFTDLSQNELVITSDTTVVLGDKVLGKPKDRDEAMEMLHSMSGKSHEVVSGVCLKSKDKQSSFSVSTKVYFKELTEQEVAYYVDEYKPYDKAGAYGIQEWIGQIAIERIEGSFYNVVGLPTAELYAELKRFFN